MKRTVLLYAAAWGVLLSGLVVLTNVVFPTPSESDDEYAGWYIVLYLGLFLLFAIGGTINAERARPLRSGAIGGAATALIIVGMIMLTFAVVDNVFLDIVSQQIDKITTFRNQTTYTSMRDFINSGLLQGAFVALPFGALVGGVLGALASLARRRLTPGTPDPAPTVSPA
jgi:hypothetical protein